MRIKQLSKELHYLGIKEMSVDDRTSRGASAFLDTFAHHDIVKTNTRINANITLGTEER